MYELSILEGQNNLNLQYKIEEAQLLTIPVGELDAGERVVEMVLDDGRAGVDQLRIRDHTKLFNLVTVLVKHK